VRASQGRDDLLAEAADVLRVPNEQLPRLQSVSSLSGRASKRRSSGWKEDLAEARLKTMTADAETINGLKIVVQKMEVPTTRSCSRLRPFS